MDDDLRVFGGLANPTRRHIVRELAAQGPLTPTALGARAGVSRQAAAEHLAVLSEVGLTHGARAGREMRYELDLTPFSRAEAWMRSIRDSWDRRCSVLARMRTGLEIGEDE